MFGFLLSVLALILLLATGQKPAILLDAPACVILVVGLIVARERPYVIPEDELQISERHTTDTDPEGADDIEGDSPDWTGH